MKRVYTICKEDDLKLRKLLLPYTIGSTWSFADAVVYPYQGIASKENIFRQMVEVLYRDLVIDAGTTLSFSLNHLAGIKRPYRTSEKGKYLLNLCLEHSHLYGLKSGQRTQDYYDADFFLAPVVFGWGCNLILSMLRSPIMKNIITEISSECYESQKNNPFIQEGLVEY